MRRVSFQQILLMCVVAFPSYDLSVSASVSQLKISMSAKLLSCEDLRKIHHDLEDKTRDELRDHLSRKFRTNWTATRAQAYALAKYYGCRFPDENDEFALYLKKFVKGYEEAEREAEKREQEPLSITDLSELRGAPNKALQLTAR